MNSTTENFINKYNPGNLSLLTRLPGAIKNSERELARVTVERDDLEIDLERAGALLEKSESQLARVTAERDAREVELERVKSAVANLIETLILRGDP